MTDKRQPPDLPLTRRELLWRSSAGFGGVALGALGLTACGSRARAEASSADIASIHQASLAAMAKTARPTSIWTGAQVNDFVDAMSFDDLKRASKTIEVPVQVSDYGDPQALKAALKVHLASATGRFRKNPDEIDYHHDILIPAAASIGVSEADQRSLNTFALEHAVYRRTIQDHWSTLTTEDRTRMLRTSEWSLSGDQVTQFALLGGAAFLTGLSAVVAVSGFTFYAGVATGMYALASMAQVTLPFMAYTFASQAIAIATGPVGWTIAALLAGAAAYAWLTRDPSVEKTRLATALHFHHLKVAALQETGGYDPRYVQ